MNPNFRDSSHSASVSGTIPLVQKLLPDGPRQKADQRVLLQRVIQKLLEVVYLRGDVQVQVTLKARVNSKNYEKTLTTYFLGYSLSELAHQASGDSAPSFLPPTSLPHLCFHLVIIPFQPVCHTAGCNKQVPFAAGGHTDC